MIAIGLPVILSLVVTLNLFSPTFEFTQRSSYMPSFLPNSANQYDSNNCWAFSTAAALEQAAVAKGYKLDEHLSVAEVIWAREKHIADPLGLSDKDYAQTYNYQGGTFQDTMLEVANSNVPVFESNITSWDSFNQLTYDDVPFKLKRAMFIDTKNQELMKSCIQQYGALCVGINIMSLQYEEKETGEHCYYNCGSPALYNKYGITHGIVIIGWDDNIPADKFLRLSLYNGKLRAAHDVTTKGAWICKNSWGSYHDYIEEDGSVLTPGCFYLSYEDAFTQMENNYGLCYDITSTVLYDNIYQYDNIAYSLFAEASSFTNTFYIIGKDSLYEKCQEVGVYFYTPGQYLVSIDYDNTEERPIYDTLDLSKLKHLTTVHCNITQSGFYHITTPNSLALTRGTKVYITLTREDGDSFYIACPSSTDTPYLVHNESIEGISYINNKLLKGKEIEITPCIKLYTKNIK